MAKETSMGFNAYVRKEEGSEISDIRLYLESLKQKVNKVGTK